MRLALALLLATLAVESAAQPSPAWTARLDGAASYYDRITDMKVDRAGNVYLCGSTYTANQFAQDYLTVKYGPDGTRAWARIFDVGENDVPTGIALDPMGNVYVTGTVGTLRYDSAGTQQWHRPTGGSAIAIDPSGNLLLVGSSGGDAAIWKLSPAGDTLWMRTHDGTAGQSDYLIDVASDAQGNVFAIGAQNLEHDQTVGDFLVLRYDPAGSFRWAGIYNGPGNAIDLTQAFALDSAGNVVVAGWVDVQGLYSGGDVGLVRFSGADGSVLSSDTVDRGFQDRPFDVALDAQGNAYVVGHSEAFFTLFDYIVVKFDAAGQEVWTRTYDGGGGQFDEATAVSVDRSGHIYVTGGAAPVAGQPPDFVTLKYDASGTLLWAARYDSPAHDLDTASHMEVDGMGNIHVAGESYGAGTQSDFLLVKYVQAQVVAPAAFLVVSGVIVDGDLGSLSASDDDRLVARPKAGPSTSRAVVRIQVEGVSPIQSPSMMGVRLEASASADTLSQKLYLFNFDTQTYEEVDATRSTLSDSVREIAAPGALSRFVQSESMSVKALMEFRETGPVPDYPWRARVDEARWLIHP